jgi:hypothetical protein
MTMEGLALISQRGVREVPPPNTKRLPEPPRSRRLAFVPVVQSAHLWDGHDPAAISQLDRSSVRCVLIQ